MFRAGTEAITAIAVGVFLSSCIGGVAFNNEVPKEPGAPVSEEVPPVSPPVPPPDPVPGVISLHRDDSAEAAGPGAQTTPSFRLERFSAGGQNLRSIQSTASFTLTGGVYGPP